MRMRYLDLNFDEPARNLAADEALLEWVEGTRQIPREGVLRIYECRQPCVVVGYGNRLSTEVRAEACLAEGIPILRRVSGGGTVVLGPGCLAYAVVLPIESTPALGTVTGTNQYVMERHRGAMAALLGQDVAIQGHTDLALGDRKFSGNAQRRRQRTVLFHGTFLLQFDLALLGRWLRMPSAEPAYRGGRDHGDFVTNLGLPANAVTASLRAAWGATEPGDASTLGPGIDRLMSDKYADPLWHARW